MFTNFANRRGMVVMSGDPAPPSCAAILIKPPWLLAATAVVGIGLHVLLRWTYTADSQVEQWLAWGGYGLTATGGLLLWLANRQFRNAGTDSDCGAADTALVMTGPYRFSRNPIYLSFAVIFVGCSMTSNAPAFAISALPLVWSLQHFVVQAEEAHLESLFGIEYQAYAERVRRWL